MMLTGSRWPSERSWITAESAGHRSVKEPDKLRHDLEESPKDPVEALTSSGHWRGCADLSSEPVRDQTCHARVAARPGKTNFRSVVVTFGS